MIKVIRYKADKMDIDIETQLIFDMILDDYKEDTIEEAIRDVIRRTLKLKKND